MGVARPHVVLTSLFTVAISAAAIAQPAPQYSWRYYRPTNTGIQGDFNEAIWIGPDGDPWIGGYNPSFEEGGIAKFVQSENRWINISNVDYPVIGHPEDVGTSRVSDIVADNQGNLWLGTGRGALKFNPSVGPGSLVKYGPTNSTIPGGWTEDVALAPDGSIWFSAYSTAWAGGGISRYQPSTNTWSFLGTDHGGSLAAQPKPGGGFFIWTSFGGSAGVDRWDSATQQWTHFPYAVGNPVGLMSKDSVDDAGNMWILRLADIEGHLTLDCKRPDGTWVTPSLPLLNPEISYAALRAFGNMQLLLVGLALDGQPHLYRFNGASWNDLGIVPHSGFIDDLDIDANGNVWICGTGTGGAQRRDAVTGHWQRYRVTNTSNFDFFNNDLAIDPQTGDVYACANAATGIGGMVKFDGQRWTCWDQYTYGLGFDWPFLTDSSEAVIVRPSTGRVVVNPLNNYTHELDGTSWTSIPGGPDQVHNYVEDSLGRLWATGHYGGLGVFESGGYTLVSASDWFSTLKRDPDRAGTIWANLGWEVLRTDGDSAFSLNSGTLPGLPAEFRGLAVDHNSVAWVGCSIDSAGQRVSALLRFNADTGQYATWQFDQNWPFPGELVYPLAVTPDGKVWMMYEGGVFPDFQRGLCWYDGTNVGVFPAPSGGEPQWGGLPHAGIKDLEVRIVPGGYELWMSCLSRGIAVLSVIMPTTAGDVNGDGSVNVADLLAVITSWGACPTKPQSCPADLDGNGVVAVSDLLLVINHWG